MLKNHPPRWVGNEVKVAEGLHAWTRSSWQKTDVKLKGTGGWSRDRCPRKNIDVIWRYRVRKAVVLELNLVRDMKVNKKGFDVFASNKRKTRANVGLLLNRTEGQEKGKKKAKILRTVFTSLFTGVLVSAGIELIFFPVAATFWI